MLQQRKEGTHGGTGPPAADARKHSLNAALTLLDGHAVNHAQLRAAGHVGQAQRVGQPHAAKPLPERGRRVHGQACTRMVFGGEVVGRGWWWLKSKTAAGRMPAGRRKTRRSACSSPVSASNPVIEAAPPSMTPLTSAPEGVMLSSALRAPVHRSLGEGAGGRAVSRGEESSSHSRRPEQPQRPACPSIPLPSLALRLTRGVEAVGEVLAHEGGRPRHHGRRHRGALWGGRVFAGGRREGEGAAAPWRGGSSAVARGEQRRLKCTAGSKPRGSESAPPWWPARSRRRRRGRGRPR